MLVWQKEIFQTEMSMDEETYLILHIHRVTHKAKHKGGSHEV